MGYIIAFVSFPAYAEMHMMYDIQENALGFPSWTVYLHGHPGYKNYQIPNNIMQDGCHWGTWVTFPQKVEAIQAAVGRYTHPIELFRSKDFLVIHKHHGYYYEAILDYLVDSRYTLEQKKISIFALTQSYQLCEDAYRLYKTNKINEHLLDLIFSIKISNLIAQNHVGKPYENVLAALKKAGVYSFLIQVHKELDKTTRLYKELTELFNNIFPKTWHVYLINANTLCNQSYCDGNSELPYHAIIAYAVREKDAWDYYRLGTPIPVNIFPIPWFLVILEHPAFYYPFQFGPYSGLKNGVDILRDPEYSPEEKSMAILAMSQLDATNYAFIIENACDWYRKGGLSVEHLYQLFKVDLPTFYKYPFFIIDYKDKEVQRALDKFISIPTIPEGLKEIAHKVKNGTLATKEEMAYMRGYREFRKTHFTLYETIPARG